MKDCVRGEADRVDGKGLSLTWERGASVKGHLRVGECEVRMLPPMSASAGVVFENELKVRARHRWQLSLVDVGQSTHLPCVSSQVMIARSALRLRVV